MPSELVAIYALCDGPEIRYVGKARDPSERLKRHRRDSHRQTPVYAWLRKHPAARIEVLAWVVDWQTAEREWIAYLRDIGADLLNLAPGGNQPHPTKAQRGNAGRAAVRARTATPTRKRLFEIRRTIGQSLIGLIRRGSFDAAARLRFVSKVAAAGVPGLREWGRSL